MLSAHQVNLVLVSLVQVLYLVQELLLSAGLMLLQVLNLNSKLLIFRND